MEASSITCPRGTSWNLGPECQTGNPEHLAPSIAGLCGELKSWGELGFLALWLFSPTPSLLLRVMSSAEAAISVGLLLTLGEAGLGNSDSVLSGRRRWSGLAISWRSPRIPHDSKLSGGRTCSPLPVAVRRLCPPSPSLGRYFRYWWGLWPLSRS